MIRKVIFEGPKVNYKEVLRYARAKDSYDEYASLLDECIREAGDLLSYRICYDRYEIVRSSDFIRFSAIETSSDTVKKALSGCDEMILFSATVGSEMDRLILRYSRTSPSKALMLSALGTERVESLCDAFCEQIGRELQSEQKSLRRRISPGYGDIPLSMQKEIFALLDCERKIGLTLGENLLMSPSKSVTALMGIGSK